MPFVSPFLFCSSKTLLFLVCHASLLFYFLLFPARCISFPPLQLSMFYFQSFITNLYFCLLPLFILLQQCIRYLPLTYVITHFLVFFSFSSSSFWIFYFLHLFIGNIYFLFIFSLEFSITIIYPFSFVIFPSHSLVYSIVFFFSLISFIHSSTLYIFFAFTLPFFSHSSASPLPRYLHFLLPFISIIYSSPFLPCCFANTLIHLRHARLCYFSLLLFSAAIHQNERSEGSA